MNCPVACREAGLMPTKAWNRLREPGVGAPVCWSQTGDLEGRYLKRRPMRDPPPHLPCRYIQVPCSLCFSLEVFVLECLAGDESDPPQANRV